MTREDPVAGKKIAAHHHLPWPECKPPSSTTPDTRQVNVSDQR